MTRFSFNIAATDGAARTGTIAMQRGEIRTPAFMPVGTAATVKAMKPESVRATGADIILGNTYHLMLRPGAERVARLGGLHKFMNWERPILTDSGGYQVMSLSELTKVGRRRASPSRATSTVRAICSARAVDGGPTAARFRHRHGLRRAGAQRPRREKEQERRWNARCAGRAARARRFDRAGSMPPEPHCSGSSRARSTSGLRKHSADALIDIGFDGYAVGGLAVGEGQEAMLGCLDFAPGQLPIDKPRYLMGVGKPDDIVEAVRRGIDMFDCVLPTRSGRTGQAFTADGPINIRNARFAEDNGPLDPDCHCPTCGTYSARLCPSPRKVRRNPRRNADDRA